MQHEAFIVKSTNIVALAGVSLPAWWPALQATSEVAGALVPILSAAWLVIQIVRFLRNKDKLDRASDE